jgi:circadian clock protein KaiB
MEMKREKMGNDEFEKEATENGQATHVFRLYVAGMTTKSTRAITNVRVICERYLAGRYDLEVIDIYQQPKQAKEDQIIATPTLIKKLPLPIQRFIGDMSDTAKFLVSIDVQPEELMITNQ